MRFMRYAVRILAVLVLLTVPVFAEQPEYEVGEVVYHQKFSEISESALSGIRKGTSSTKQSEIVCDGETLSINTYDDGRVYAILPASDWTESFTMEFDFSFTEVASRNGYIAVMLTSTGDEPGNISSVVFRAKGTVDNFGTVSEDIVKSIRDGEKVHVTIPIVKGVLSKIILKAGEETQELERKSILLIGNGNRGFYVRNASVDISEVFIVNGTDYEEKTGFWAENSYVENNMSVTEEGKAEIPLAPATGESAAAAAAAAAGSAAVVKRLRDNFRK